VETEDALVEEPDEVITSFSPPPRPPAPTLSSLAPADSSTFTLRHHLAALASRYPGTPYASRAQSLAALLPEPPPPPPDTTASAAPDSLAASPDVPMPADSLATPAAVPADEPAPADGIEVATLSGLRSPDPIDLEAGGYTWRVRTVTLAEEGAPMVRVLRDAGFRIALLQENGTGAFIIAMGQFGTEAEALTARPGLPAWAQLRGAIVDLGGYTSAEGESEALERE